MLGLGLCLWPGVVLLLCLELGLGLAIWIEFW